MPAPFVPIEDYALLGDTHTAALVSRGGSIDWLCMPRFDSGALFASLLGTPDHGRWLIAPVERARATRRYRDGSLVLESDFETASGSVRIVDFMPPRSGPPDIVRIVRGLSGRVPMRMELIIRFDYGSIVPWVHRADGRLHAVAGPDAVTLDAPVALRGQDLRTCAEFEVAPGQEVPFVLMWHPSHQAPPPPLDAGRAAEETTRWWARWSGRSTYRGPWREAVERSLVVLKALTFAPTGGIIAAPTTSLPEELGGVRNWDYRYCWLRDATFTLDALMSAGYVQEAGAWRDWLVRAVAGEPSKFQILYGPSGERRLPELTLPWLPGYAGSAPVRIGNAAHSQFQLDVYGEVIDALHQAALHGVAPEAQAWNVARAVLDFLESGWREPDEGIWEVRGPRRHFTHSKVLAWTAFDRAVRHVERYGEPGPVERWRALRDEIRADVMRNGVNHERGRFKQAYDLDRLDANLLMLPLVGFIPPDDPVMSATIAAIAQELVDDGFVRRYLPDPRVDGLPHGEGVFLMCTFWLADCLDLLGRREEATALFERLLSLRNDVGLLAEEYDPAARRMRGNFPQAFSHVSLVNTALRLTAGVNAPARRRAAPT
ncbi:MAG: glycoside hydrolase family 15 protein [Acidobacteria bacterium]|nr:glycoside hydrolase family 15 protein [Acidobacteriota bacterium]